LHDILEYVIDLAKMKTNVIFNFGDELFSKYYHYKENIKLHDKNE